MPDPLTTEERLELSKMKTVLGVMTIPEVRELAEMDAKFAKDCGPGDIAFNHFNKSSKAMFRYAELLEKEESEVKDVG